MSVLFTSILSLLVLFKPDIQTFILFFIGVFLILKGARQPRIFNPYYALLPCIFSLMIYSDSVSSYFLPPLTSFTWVIIVVSLLATAIGMLMADFGANRSIVGYRYPLYPLIALGLLPHALGLMRVGIPALAPDVEYAREHYMAPLLGQFAIFLPVSILVAFRNGYYKHALVLGALALALSVMQASRASIILVLFFIIYVLSKAGYFNRLSFLQAIFGLSLSIVGGAVTFNVVSDIRLEQEQTAYFWRQELRIDSAIADDYGDFIYGPYIYATSPWSNLGYAIENRDRNDLTYGSHSSRSVISLFQLDGIFPPPDKEIRAFPFNTHAFPTDFYLDFDIYGVGILSLILGYLIMRSFRLSLATDDSMVEAIWVCVGCATSLLFFSNHFTGVGYPLVALVLCGGSRVLYKLLIPVYGRLTTK